MNSQRFPGSQLQNESTPFHIVLTFIGSPGVGTPEISLETHPPQSPLFICCHNFIHQSCPSATIRRRGEHEMVGLSVILESSKDRSEKMIRRRPQVHVSKGTMIRPVALNDSPSSSSSSSSSFSGVPTKTPTCGFLERCFLCKQKLLSGKDIYMYRGDKAFCSEECRSRQIFMDEEEQAKSCCTREYNCCTTASTCARRGKGTTDLGNAFVF